MEYKHIRADLISTYLLCFLLEQKKILMPRPDDAARLAVKYANALICQLDSEYETQASLKKKIARGIISCEPIKATNQ